MPLQIHQLLIEPGSTVRLVCKDGLSAATVYNIDKIYRFGGDFKFVHCGPGAISAGLSQAVGSMYEKLYQTVDTWNKNSSSPINKNHP